MTNIDRKLLERLAQNWTTQATDERVSAATADVCAAHAAELRAALRTVK